jgi:hypothetical protein
MASKRISQATFDEAVKENMETFGQSREEAVADAIAQFESANVDLSNIVTSADAETHPVLKAVGTLKSAAEPLMPQTSESIVDLSTTSSTVPTDGTSAVDAGFLDPLNEEAIKPVRDALISLEEEVHKDPMGTRSVAGSNNAIKWLTLMVGALSGDLRTVPAAVKLATIGADGAPAYVHHPLLQPTMRVLRHLCAEHAENRALVGVGFASVLLKIMNTSVASSSAEASAISAETSDNIVALRSSAMHLAALLCVKREGYKVALFTRGLPAAVATVLEEANTAIKAAASSESAMRVHEQQSSLVTAACSVLSRVLQDDDLSIEASKVYSYARAIAVTAPENTATSSRGHSSAALALGVLPESPLLPSGMAGKMLNTFVLFESDP